MKHLREIIIFEKAIPNGYDKEIDRYLIIDDDSKDRDHRHTVLAVQGVGSQGTGAVVYPDGGISLGWGDRTETRDIDPKDLPLYIGWQWKSTPFEKLMSGKLKL